LFNAGEIVVDNTVYRLRISPSVPEIFAIKSTHACTNTPKTMSLATTLAQA